MERRLDVGNKTFSDAALSNEVVEGPINFTSCCRPGLGNRRVGLQYYETESSVELFKLPLQMERRQLPRKSDMVVAREWLRREGWSSG